MTDFYANIFEKLIFSEKKETVLSEIPPNTKFYKFIETIIAFNNPNTPTDKLEMQINELTQLYPNSDSARIVSLKLFLQKIEQNKNNLEIVKELANQLNKNGLIFRLITKTHLVPNIDRHFKSPAIPNPCQLFLNHNWTQCHCMKQLKTFTKPRTYMI